MVTLKITIVITEDPLADPIDSFGSQEQSQEEWLGTTWEKMVVWRSHLFYSSVYIDFE